MPIYEYECKNCDHSFDELQKMNDASLVDCPSCGESALARLLSAPSFRLKGGGWYETDFKKDNQRNVAKNDNESNKKKTDNKKETNVKKEKNETSSAKPKKKETKKIKIGRASCRERV